MADHKKPLALATASWIDLHGLTQAYRAAVVRGDVVRAEEIRMEAHAMLDANLDQNGEVGVALRDMLGA